VRNRALYAARLIIHLLDEEGRHFFNQLALCTPESEPASAFLVLCLGNRLTLDEVLLLVGHAAKGGGLATLFISATSVENLLH
jgi:hypothetical protein